MTRTPSQLLQNEDYYQQSTFKRLVFGWRKRLRKNKDVAVVITGEPGDGKSTLAVQLAMLLDPKFEFKRNVLFDPTIEDMHKAIYGLPKHAPIVIDEAIRVGYKRNWQSSKNKLLNEMLALCRFQNKVLIFCIPHFSTIDKDLQQRLLFWLHIPKTGVAVFFRKSRKPFGVDAWNLKLNNRIFERAVKNEASYDFSKFMKSASRSPNFISAFRFGALPKGLEEEYDACKPAFKLDRNSPEDKKSRRTKQHEKWITGAMIELSKRGYAQSKIAKVMGTTPGTVNKYLNESDYDVTDYRRSEKKKQLVKNEVIPEFDL